MRWGNESARATISGLHSEGVYIADPELGKHRPTWNYCEKLAGVHAFLSHHTSCASLGMIVPSMYANSWFVRPDWHFCRIL